MARTAVPAKVLGWLHSVLKAEYYDVDRTYADTAQALAEFSTLRPSTEVFTAENGVSALLLRLTGTIPVAFRQAVFSFPITIWFPHAYPQEAPSAWVTPSPDMAVRAGQYVSGEGRFYHPYLANWKPEISHVLDLLGAMQDAFSREPPLVARQQQQQSMASPPVARHSSVAESAPSAPPRPPRPPELQPKTSTVSPSASTASAPPRRPPKPTDRPSQNVSDAPPLPPKPHPPSQAQRPSSSAAYPGRIDTASTTSGAISSPRFSSGFESNISPLQQSNVAHYSQHPPSNVHSPHAYLPPENYPTQAYSPSTLPQYVHPQHHGQLRTSSVGPPSTNYGPVQTVYSQAPAQSTQQIYQKKASEDLLTSPFDLPLPTQPTNLPAPPIPPNPEKDALLGSISRTLTTELHRSLEANASALERLAAQHSALNMAAGRLEAEAAALDQMQTLVATDETLLHAAMRDADACIANARGKAVAPLDEMLVAPTVVGEQLYTLTAEEGACADAREVLSRALDAGRINGEAWVRAVRFVAREEFLKKVLAQKAAEGMGLLLDEEWG